MRLVAVHGFCIGALLVAGAACGRREPTPDLNTDSTAWYANSDLYQRVHEEFHAPDYLKPPESEGTDLLVSLAPLLLVRRTGGVEPAEERFAVVEPTGTGFRLKPGRPTVYVTTSEVLVEGQIAHQVAYIWCFRDGPDDPWQMQGVRMTLDARMLPRTWEVLHEGHGRRVIYVSEKLEKAARARFGEPAPFRAHTVEQSVAGVAVPRILEDGPVPMGPWVYLWENNEVTTVLCRCMSSQAAAIRDGVHYRLKRWPTREDPLLLLMQSGSAWSERLDTCLRLVGPL